LSASYEFWLCDDSGRRITLLPNISFASFSRTTRGLGTIMLGLPLDSYLSYVPIIFQPDMRIDCWRSPEYGYPKRREGSFFLRKYNVYDRADDGVRMIDFYGRSPLDILRRWCVIGAVASRYTKTDCIDNIMKAVVTDSFITDAEVVPLGEFSVDGNLSLGPSITQSFQGKNIRDILDDLKATSFNMNATLATNRRIFFDVVEGPGLTNGFGYIFRTYADLRGIDRTKGIVFSAENGNLKRTSYYEDYLDEITIAQVGAITVNGVDTNLSRWNNILRYQGSSSSVAGADTAKANELLYTLGKKFSLTASFLSTPGSPSQPRSLYGVDWDLGDLLPVQFAGKNMTAEVEIVWISIDENGKENIVGSNQVGLQ